MVEPIVPMALEATLVTLRSALVATGVTTALVLLPGVGSGVVLVPMAVLVTLPVLLVTVAVTTRLSVWLSARLAAVAIAPVLLVLKSKPPVTTGVPDRLKPFKTSVSVTFWAVLGPKLTSVKV